MSQDWADENSFGQLVGKRVDRIDATYPRKEVLHGQYCRIEALDPKLHATALFAANNQAADARSWTYLGYGPFDECEQYHAWMEKACNENDPAFYAVIDRTTDSAVGVASYLRIAPEQGSIEVGHINYSPLLQRRRASTEAMYLMMKHAFDLGYRRYEWKCDALNAPSRAAALRLGFTFEGIHRQALVVKGRNRDTAWYSILDSEWPALRAEFERWLSPENFNEDEQQLSRLLMTP